MGFDRRRVLLVQVWVIYWHVFFDADKEKSCNIIIRLKGKCFNDLLVKVLSTNLRGVKVEYMIMTSEIKSQQKFSCRRRK